MLRLDLHADTLMGIVHEGHRLDGTTASLGQVDVPRLRRGGLDAQVFVVFVTPYWVGPMARARCHALIDRLERELGLEEVRPQIGLARTVDDARSLNARGRLAAFLGVEGGHVLGGDPAEIDGLALRGARYLTITWVNGNEMADSSGSPPAHRGLSPAGRETVRRMERAGMLVDVSHASDETVRDVIGMATEPVIASHSGCRRLDDHPRNLTDDQLRAIAATGGVVGIPFHSAFLGGRARAVGAQRWRNAGFEQPEAEERKDRLVDHLGVAVPLERLADHVLHALETAGPEHVALGSDFDGRITPPVGLADVGALPSLRAALRQRGASTEVLDAVWGGNAERVFVHADRVRVAWGSLPGA